MTRLLRTIVMATPGTFHSFIAPVMNASKLLNGSEGGVWLLDPDEDVPLASKRKAADRRPERSANAMLFISKLFLRRLCSARDKHSVGHAKVNRQVFHHPL